MCCLVIDQMEEEGWQSDERFAESYSRMRVQKGYGELRIQQELRERGIRGYDINMVVEELIESWDALAHKVYENKYGDQFDERFKEIARRSRFLQHRGFTAEQIRGLFAKLKLENQKR